MKKISGSFQNRGMFLESIINKAIITYLANDTALFHKKELKIKLTSVVRDKNGQTKVVGLIKQKSTVDYFGLFRGSFVALEAKSTNESNLALKNIPMHQRQYLDDVAKHKGHPFYIIAFSKYGEYFLVRPQIIDNLTRKSLTIDLARKKGCTIEIVYPGFLDFIKCLKKFVV